MINTFGFYFNVFFILIFFPSFVTGVFLPNLICGLFIISNFIINFKAIKKLYFDYYIISYLFSFFCIFIILSSFFSEHVYHSLETSALYFLFLIYTLSIVILFSGNIKLRTIFFLCGITTCFVLSIDAFYELITGSNILGFSSIDGRIAGLFGKRWLIGRYLIYILPIIVGIYFLELDHLKKYKLIFYITIILTSLIIIFSGERAAFIMFIIYSLLIFMYFVKKLSYLKSLQILLFITLLCILPFLFTESSERIKNNFILYLTNTDLDKNHYLSLFFTSWKMFVENPLLGIGPNNFRIVCSDYSYHTSNLGCSTHPHSITFQVLAELGIFGFIAVFSVFCYFFYKSFLLTLSKHYSHNSLGIYSLQCCILLYLFPFMITGNFFLSWYGFIFYLPIGLFIVYSSKLK